MTFTIPLGPIGSARVRPIEPGAILTDAEIEALFAARTPDTQEAASRQKDQLVHGEVE